MFTKSAVFKSITILASFCCLLGNTYAQDNELVLKKNALKIAPTSLFVSTFALSYERHITNSMSLQLAGGIAARERDAYRKNFFDEDDFHNGTQGNGNPSLQDKVSGGFGELAMRFYFVKGQSMISGLYAGPFARYNSYTYRVNYGNDPYNDYPNSIPTDKVANYKSQSYEGGVMFGWQWVIKNSFLFDMYAGCGVRASTLTDRPLDYGRSDYSFKILESQSSTGVIAKIGVKLGFVF